MAGGRGIPGAAMGPNNAAAMANSQAPAVGTFGTMDQAAQQMPMRPAMPSLPQQAINPQMAVMQRLGINRMPFNPMPPQGGGYGMPRPAPTFQASVMPRMQPQQAPQAAVQPNYYDEYQPPFQGYGTGSN